MYRPWSIYLNISGTGSLTNYDRKCNNGTGTDLAGGQSTYGNLWLLSGNLWLLSQSFEGPF